MAVDKAVVEVNAVIDQWFNYANSERSTVNASYLRLAIQSIMTRCDNADYVAPTSIHAATAAAVTVALPDAAGFVTMEGAVATGDALTETSAEITQANTAVVPMDNVIIAITNYQEDAVYSFEPGLVGYEVTATTGAEFVILDGGFDKLSIHRQNGTITLTGKITEAIVDRVITIEMVNKYYETFTYKVELNVGLLA